MTSTCVESRNTAQIYQVQSGSADKFSSHMLYGYVTGVVRVNSDARVGT